MAAHLQESAVLANGVKIPVLGMGKFFFLFLILFYFSHIYFVFNFFFFDLLLLLFVHQYTQFAQAYFPNQFKIIN